MMIQSKMYASRPGPPSTANTTNSTRTSVASMLKYSATPPHTPASWRLVRLRYSLRGPSMASPFTRGPVMQIDGSYLLRHIAGEHEAHDPAPHISGGPEHQRA